MVAFTIHIRLDAEYAESGAGRRLLEPFTEQQGVSFSDDTVEATGSDVVVPETSSLAIEDLDTFAEIYMALRDEPAVQDISLWGPSAERYPIPVQHYALQQISQPTLYEYYALNDKVTLVVADDEMVAQAVQREVPDPALGFPEPSPL